MLQYNINYVKNIQLTQCNLSSVIVCHLSLILLPDNKQEASFLL